MKVHATSIRNRDLLYSLYVEQDLSSNEIGRRLSVNSRLVRTWLKNFGIPMRSQVEACKISATRYLKKKVLVRCVVCEKEFEVHLYRTKKSKKLYCSRDCQIQDHQDSLTIASAKFRKEHPRIERICPVCNKLFTVPFSHGRRKHCSDQCKGITHMLSLAGKKGPNKIEGKILDIIVNNSLDFKYNGNGEIGVVLGGMIPDFVNTDGKKQVIEVFGDYYHTKLAKRWNQTEEGRIKAYKKTAEKTPHFNAGDESGILTSCV